MLKVKHHIIFWICYFIYCYITDKILDPSTTVISTLLFFLTQNVYLFYSLYYFIKHYSNETRKATIKSVVILGVILSVFFLVRYFVRYHILGPYINPEFGLLGIRDWLVVSTIWITGYFFYALAYYFFTTSFQKQRLLTLMLQERLTKDKERLELENALLKVQINPHFLYNSLNYIYAKSLPVSAELSNAILKMSEIMRYSIEQQDRDGFVQVSAEVAHIQNLIEMARLRFSNNIYLQLDVDQELNGIRILPLALVTLVENVLKHGKLNDQDCPARIYIGRNGIDELKFSTWNKKRSGPKEHSTNIGLKNTIRRLEETYGKSCSIRISDNQDTFQTEIRLQLSSNN